MPMIETLTPTEIAQMLRIHPFTVTRLAREGKLPALKVGGVWRFRKDEFERWMQKAATRTSRPTQRRSRRVTRHLMESPGYART